MSFKTIMSSAHGEFYPLRILDVHIALGDLVAADTPAMIAETAKGQRITIICTYAGRIINFLPAGTVLEKRQMLLLIEFFDDPREITEQEVNACDKQEKIYPEKEVRTSKENIKSSTTVKKSHFGKRVFAGVAIISIACVSLYILTYTDTFKVPEPGDYAKIAEATCTGKFDGLGAMKIGAYDDKSTNAMTWLRWLYVNKDCVTYIGYGSEANKPLLAAAHVGDAESAYTIGSYMLQGIRGFTRDPQGGEKWLQKAVDEGSNEASFMLADEYISSNNLPQNLSHAKKLINRMKRRYGPNSDWMIGSLEMNLRDAQSKLAAKTEVTANDLQSAVNTSIAMASPTQSTTDAVRLASVTPNSSGEKGDMVFNKLPLRLECWGYENGKSSLTDSLMTVIPQNELRDAKSDQVLKYGGPLKIYNYFYFSMDVHSYPHSHPNKWYREIGVAYKLSFYASADRPMFKKCRTMSSYFYDSRDEMLANLNQYGSMKQASNLNWHHAPLPPPDVLEKLKSVGIVRN